MRQFDAGLNANGKRIGWYTRLEHTDGLNNGVELLKNNFKYIDGPLKGEHVGYNPLTGEQFYAGHKYERLLPPFNWKK